MEAVYRGKIIRIGVLLQKQDEKTITEGCLAAGGVKPPKSFPGISPAFGALGLSGLTYFLLLFNSCFPITVPLVLQFRFALRSLGCCHASQAQMRTFIGIEIPCRMHCWVYLLNSIEFRTFKQLVLDGIVYLFGYGIVFGLATLCDAYTYILVLQSSGMGITGVLYPSAGMMDEPCLVGEEIDYYPYRRRLFFKNSLIFLVDAERLFVFRPGMAFLR